MDNVMLCLPYMTFVSPVWSSAGLLQVLQNEMCVSSKSLMNKKHFLHAKSWIPAGWEIDIHGCYSLVKIAITPICACKNYRRIWCHNANTLHLRDDTDQLCWRHNVKSEKTFNDLYVHDIE